MFWFMGCTILICGIQARPEILFEFKIQTCICRLKKEKGQCQRKCCLKCRQTSSLFYFEPGNMYKHLGIKCIYLKEDEKMCPVDSKMSWAVPSKHLFSVNWNSALICKVIIFSRTSVIQHFFGSCLNSTLIISLLGMSPHQLFEEVVIFSLTNVNVWDLLGLCRAWS